MGRFWVILTRDTNYIDYHITASAYIAEIYAYAVVNTSLYTNRQTGRNRSRDSEKQQLVSKIRTLLTVICELMLYVPIRLLQF